MKKRFFVSICFLIFITTLCFGKEFSPQAMGAKQKFENFFKGRGINVKIVLDKEIPDKKIQKKLKGFRMVSLKLWKGKRQQILSFLTDGDIIIRDIEFAGRPVNLVETFQSELMTYKVDVSDDELIAGKPDAKVKIVIFGDFQCPFCRRAMSFILPKYRNNPNIAIYFKHFPLPFHKYAKAMSKVFIAGQMVGVNLIDFIEKYQIPRGKKVEEVEKDLIDKASKIIPENKRGLFLQLVKDKSILKKVDENVAQGRKLGVTGTPTIFVNGKKIVGLKPNLIAQFINEALKNAK